MTGVVWLEDDVDNDARFWELHCALTGTAPGPSDQWSLRGRTLSASSAAIPPPRRSKPARARQAVAALQPRAAVEDG